MRLFIILFLLSTHVAMGQTIDIKGTKFDITLNKDEMTAGIRDFNYKIDDRKYPININKRSFKELGNEHVRTITIPSSYKADDGKEYKITTIGRAAFAGFDNVDNIVLPSTITTIEDYAFFRCSVVSIEIPASVTQIGNRVFGRCPKLRNLT